MALPWFRLYAEIIDDETMEFLSFEDQRHFIWILAMKCAGILDKKYPEEGMRERIIARKLGLQGEALENAKKRLLRYALIDQDWQPVNWDKRQRMADHSAADRMRKYRENKRKWSGDVTSDVTVTQPFKKSDVLDTDTDTDTDTEKEKPLRVPRDAFFDSFWKAYPVKKSKGAAEKAFARIRPDGELMARILESIKNAKTSEQWRKGFIQHPATWLNAKGWEDEEAPRQPYQHPNAVAGSNFVC